MASNTLIKFLSIYLRFYVFTFVSKVLIKKDFPFANVPVPSVHYVNDTEPQVTLKCSFDFPTRDNVSFEVQWFVTGRSVTPTLICDNPNESTCDRRESLLGTSEYGPGDTVSHGLRTFASTVTTQQYGTGCANLNSPSTYPLNFSFIHAPNPPPPLPPLFFSFLFVDFSSTEFLHFNKKYNKIKTDVREK